MLNQENPRERREMRTEERERDVEDISGEKVRSGLRKIKKGKAQESDDLPMEAWIALENKGVEFLVNFFNRLLRGKKMPDEWRKSVLVLCTKAKETSRNVEITGDQVDEPHNESVGEGDRSKDKEGGDDR